MKPRPVTGEFDRQLGQLLRACRMARELTLAAVAARIRGLTPQTLRNYEVGRRALPVEYFGQLAALYDVAPDDLIPGGP